MCKALTNLVINSNLNNENDVKKKWKKILFVPTGLTKENQTSSMCESKSHTAHCNMRSTQTITAICFYIFFSSFSYAVWLVLGQLGWLYSDGNFWISHKTKFTIILIQSCGWNVCGCFGILHVTRFPFVITKHRNIYSSDHSRHCVDQLCLFCSM